MIRLHENGYYKLDVSNPVWEQIFTVAPLVVVGTKEGDTYDLAPKHLAIPIGFDNYFGFVCTPKHKTYHNVKNTKEFSVSFPLPNQVVLASLSASPRCEENSGTKPIIDILPTLKASTIDALFLAESYLFLECKLFKIIDGFNENSIITGTIVAAYCHKDYLKVSEKDQQQQLKENPILAYIAQGRFASITETYNFPFPKDFKH
jgi:flavin reductase (DIM6/NTAB) family NADH-FMN oxidoreductase RutF